MILSANILIRIGIFILGACGFAVAKHIHNHKKPKSAPLVCPMKFDCHSVVHSEYSTFFGVHLEVLGMLYYLAETVFYFYLIFMPSVVPVPLVLIAITLALVAFLFSAYLIFVQIFVLKKGCFWCFISAGISILIFALTIYAYDFSSIAMSFIN